ncbi:P-loop NTPase fold protein [Bacillus thuringiensis]|uniref:P-loop NTPase fold protein n=1 Tax=Bacillus thuringiensis TaxID=1428 RepID=UPI001FB66891|nr:P-loop NTPase fold protein [Bacillus thuringiensis]
MNHQYNKTKEFLKKSAVILLIFVLLFDITVIKNLIKELLIFVQSFDRVDFELSQIKQAYFLLRKYALLSLVLCIMLFLGIKFYLFIRDYFNRPKRSELNNFEDSLYKYINDKPNGKGYLVTGEWGSGKTHIVTEFFDKYYKFSSKPIYRISCFGLDSRKHILDEIKNQIEINDNSLFNWVQYIPAFGKPLFSMLKGSYSLNSIPKGSIFIFDDFERITSLGINTNGRIQQSYKKDTFMLSDYAGTQKSREFKEIKKEFEKIERAFDKYDKHNEMISITDNLQKYNVATGLINELIENYKVKVIIICNVDILGYGFVDTVFRGKLDCITYNKCIDKNSIESIFNSIFENQIFSNKTVKELVSHVINDLIVDFEKVWSSNDNSNLREVKSVIQAFLDTTNIIGSKVNLNKDYLFSLFYSIYVVGVLRDKKQLKNLDNFLIGGNLAFLLNLYDKQSLYNSLKLSDHLDKLKWTGISIAGFWMLNMKMPENLDNLVRYYTDYECNDLEIALLQPYDSNWNEGKVLVEHLIYIIKYELRTQNEEYDDQMEALSGYIKMNLQSILGYNQDSEQSIERKVRDLLVKIEVSLGGVYNHSVLGKWWAAIYEYSKVESIIKEKGTYTIDLYNEFVQKNKPIEEVAEV